MISSELMTVLVEAFSALPVDEQPTPFDTHLETHRQWADDDAIPAPTLRRALTFWTRLHGILSLELAGHFDGMGFGPAFMFAAEIDSL